MTVFKSSCLIQPTLKGESVLWKVSITSTDFSLSISQLLWLPQSSHYLESKHRWEGTSQEICFIIPVRDKDLAFRGQLLNVSCDCLEQTKGTMFEQILSSPMNRPGGLQSRMGSWHIGCSEITQQTSYLLLSWFLIIKPCLVKLLGVDSLWATCFFHNKTVHLSKCSRITELFLRGALSILQDPLTRAGPSHWPQKRKIMPIPSWILWADTGGEKQDGPNSSVTHKNQVSSRFRKSGCSVFGRNGWNLLNIDLWMEHSRDYLWKEIIPIKRRWLSFIQKSGLVVTGDDTLLSERTMLLHALSLGLRISYRILILPTTG